MHQVNRADTAGTSLFALGATTRESRSVYDPNNPVGRLLFNVLGMVAEFKADLIRARTREGMQIAKAAGKLRGRQPTLSKTKRKHLLDLAAAGKHTQAELTELFDVSRTMIYRELRRATK